jgi:hypothetical protein
VIGNDGRLAGGELGQAEPGRWEPGTSGRMAGPFAAAHAYLTGPRLGRTPAQGGTSGYAAAAGTAGTLRALAGREVGDDLGLFGPDRPELEDIRAGEDASASAWAEGEAEWPPSDPWARRGLHNLVSRMAEEVGWRPDEMVQVRAGGLDNALLVAVSALYEVDRRLEAAPAQPAGDMPSPPEAVEPSVEMGDFEAG